jgi:hypothetical protein
MVDVEQRRVPFEEEVEFVGSFCARYVPRSLSV